jgi:hypothetical protein
MVCLILNKYISPLHFSNWGTASLNFLTMPTPVSVWQPCSGPFTFSVGYSCPGPLFQFDTPALARCFSWILLPWPAVSVWHPCSGPLFQFDTPAMPRLLFRLDIPVLARCFSFTPLLWSAYCFSWILLIWPPVSFWHPSLWVSYCFSWIPLLCIYLRTQQNSEKFNQNTPVTFTMCFAEHWVSEGDIWEFRKHIAFVTKLASITLSVSNYISWVFSPFSFIIAAAIYLHCK